MPFGSVQLIKRPKNMKIRQEYIKILAPSFNNKKHTSNDINVQTWKSSKGTDGQHLITQVILGRRAPPPRAGEGLKGVFQDNTNKSLSFIWISLGLQHIKQKIYRKRRK